MASTARWPSGRRATWTTASTEEWIWARMASTGRPVPARRTRLSRRARASAGPVGVDGAERAAVAGVERLEEVEGLLAPDLADDQPVGPEPQRGPDERPDRDRTGALGVGRPGLEPDDVRLAERQLGGLLDRDDALRRRRPRRRGR